MSVKQVVVEGIGPVSLYKRRGTKHIRITIAGGHAVRVTLPSWAPYHVGVEFALRKKDWIAAQLQPAVLLKDGMAIGKAHHLRFEHHDKSVVQTRLIGNEVVIRLPLEMLAENPAAQTAAKRAALRALRKEAEHLLPQRLTTLAQTHGFSYACVQIKPLKSRWGSCTQDKRITLNCYLMQLSWAQIDYVILHELTHTRIMAHGEPFWSELSHYVSDLPAMRKSMRAKHPSFS